MWSSAMASSSPVLTPGRTAAFTAAMAPAVTSPEARMSSISCGVLIWIMRPLHFASSGRRLRMPAVICSPLPADRAADPSLRARGTVLDAQRPHRPARDHVDLADGIDPGEQAFTLVEPGHRGSLFLVDVQPVAHGLG